MSNNVWVQGILCSLITFQYFTPCVRYALRNYQSIIAWLICPSSGRSVLPTVTRFLSSVQQWQHCINHWSVVALVQCVTCCLSSMSPMCVSWSQSLLYTTQFVSYTPSIVHMLPIVVPIPYIMSQQTLLLLREQKYSGRFHSFIF